MDESDFTRRLQYITEIENQIKDLKKDFNSLLILLPSKLKGLIEASDQRDLNFKDYIQEIRKLSNNDNNSSLPTPVSLFPGVRPSLDNIDFENLKKVSSKMESEAQEIELQNKEFELYKVNDLKELKSLLNKYIEIIQQEDLLYEEELKLLRDLDSPYDVGQVAYNTQTT